MRHLFALCLLCVGLVLGFSESPGSCSLPSDTSMSPQQSTPFPGTIAGPINSTSPTYQGAVPYTLTISNTAGIKGILVHFTDAAGSRRGTFSAGTAGTSTSVPVCAGAANDANSALGHTRATQQQPCPTSGALACAAPSVTFTWTAPPTSRGDLTLAIVLVQDLTHWWRMTVTVKASAGTPAPPAPAPSPASPPGTPPPATASCGPHCDEMMRTCPTQFPDLNTCLRYCATYPAGPTGGTTGDNFVCRDYHLAVAKTLGSSPASQRWHCSHAGPTGGKSCFDATPASLCESYCRYEGRFCNGSSYPDLDTCLAVCPYINSITTEESTRTSASVEFDITKTSGNSIECRHYHLEVASQGGPAATTHCPHTLQDGGNGVCGTVCEAYCDIYMGVCTAAVNSAGAYTDRQACLAACASMDQTAPLGSTSGDTAQCRLYHASVAAQVSPAVHCPHAAALSVDGALPGPCADPCANYCGEIMATCNPANNTPTQHSSLAACMADCAVQMAGQPGALSGNSLGCRAYHVSVATNNLNSPTAASQHCAHAGPTGATICGSACEVYCASYQAICSAKSLEKPYANVAECLTFCGKMNASDVTDSPPWSTTITSGNTLGCRQYHLNVAAGLNSADHCNHASWGSSGGVCGADFEQYCQYYSQTCPTGFSSDYGSMGACAAYVQTLATGATSDTSGNTFNCRLYHLSVAVRLSATAGLNNVHCEHASKLGGTVCSTLCPDYCQGIMTNCSAGFEQYGTGPAGSTSFSLATCLAVCQNTPAGQPGDAGNSVQCRVDQLAQVATNCAVAGPAGVSGQLTNPTCGSACDNYCSRMMSTCVGANAQYSSLAECQALCARMTLDTVAFSSNIQIDATLQCRTFYLTAATQDPTANCPKAGYLGGNTCGNLVPNFCSLYEVACPNTAAADLNGLPCEDVFGAKPAGVIGATSGDTMACRGYHVQVAFLQPTTDNIHCQHASLAGGGVCVPPVTCGSLCGSLSTTCTGANLVLADTLNCTNWCESLTLGSFGDTTGNTVGCRQYHVGVAAAAPANAAVHCPHAGFSGGGVCGEPCDVYCAQIMGTCTGPLSQYSSVAACKAICASFNSSAPFLASTTGGASLACRSYHLQVASSQPELHCTHAGPTGGGVCGSPCDAYCDQMMTTCVTPNIASNIFASHSECMAACGQYDVTGAFGATLGNTLQCRAYHVGVAAQLDPTAHCAHASPTSVAGVCAPSNAGVSCPAGSRQINFAVDTAAKVSPFTGYPTGFKIEGVLQAPLCLQVGDCAVFSVNTPDCFHPFYIDGSAGTGGSGLASSIGGTQLASTANFACAGSAVAFYADTAGSFTYQCSSHSQMGGAITVQAAACAPMPTPAPPASPTPSPIPVTGPSPSPAPSSGDNGTSPSPGGGSGAAALAPLLALWLH